MVRTKEFQRDEVLTAATQVFWEKGYKATSISDLTEATGLGKRSMYKEFENKEGLFKACIEHYVLTIQARIGQTLRRSPLGVQNVRDFFRDRIEYAATPSCRGCLLVNSSVEKESIDLYGYGLIQQSLSNLERVLFDCLSAAQEAGEISDDKDCKVIAGMLATFAMGMMVECRGGVQKADLERKVALALSVLV